MISARYAPKGIPRRVTREAVAQWVNGGGGGGKCRTLAVNMMASDVSPRSPNNPATRVFSS